MILNLWIVIPTLYEIHKIKCPMNKNDFTILAMKKVSGEDMPAVAKKIYNIKLLVRSS